MWIVGALFLPAAVAFVAGAAWLAMRFLRAGSPFLATLVVVGTAGLIIGLGSLLTRGMKAPPDDEPDDRQHWP